MHDSVLAYFRRECPRESQLNKSCLEIGSLDCGGTLRTVLSHCREYVGLDMREGSGVDVVAMAETYRPARSYDLVVSAGTLEHCEHWQEVLWTMKYLLSPGGTLLLTTVSPGFHRHNFPSDYWRFTPSVLAEAFKDMPHTIEHNPENFDIFLRAEKPQVWTPFHPESVIAPEVDSCA